MFYAHGRAISISNVPGVVEEVAHSSLLDWRGMWRVFPDSALPVFWVQRGTTGPFSAAPVGMFGQPTSPGFSMCSLLTRWDSAAGWGERVPGILDVKSIRGDYCTERQMALILL
jgi:hypothetical protein